MASGKLNRANKIAEFIIRSGFYAWSFALATEPDLPKALFLKAQIAMRQKNEDMARPAVQQILRIAPQGDTTRVWELNYLREMNNQQERIELKGRRRRVQRRNIEHSGVLQFSICSGTFTR